MDLGGFALLMSSGVPLPSAAALSFLIATLINYLLSARFVFQAAISARDYLRFLTVACLGLVVNVTATILADAAGLPVILAKTSGIGVAFGVNFLLNLVLVFRQTRRTGG